MKKDDKRVYIDQKVFERLCKTNPDLQKQALLNNAVSVYLNCHKLFNGEFQEYTDDAIEDGLQAYKAMGLATLYELRGKFSKGELKVQLQAMNGIFASQVPLWEQIADAEIQPNAGYDFELLTQKLKTLNPIQQHFWQRELCRFWRVIAEREESYERFLKKYAHE